MTKILLAAPLLHLADPEFNRRQILTALQAGQAAQADLVLLGEASLQGFDFLRFHYAEDIRRVATLHGEEIASLQEAARRAGVGLGLGFYENYIGEIHSSYIVIDKKGEVADVCRRVSPGWKKAGACADYREGPGFHSFGLDGRHFAVLICGDLWEGRLLTSISVLDEEADAFFWPVHVDIPPERWNSSNRDFQALDDLSCLAYAHQSALLEKPVLFINNYLAEQDRAKGGLYHWEQGRTKASLPMGESGYLLTEV